MRRYSESVFGPGTCCRVCGSPRTEVHHIFYGPYRSKSEKWGMKVRLCREHHEGIPHGVHGGNRDLDLSLKAEAQRRFEALHGHEMFMREFGRNYISG